MALGATSQTVTSKLHSSFKPTEKRQGHEAKFDTGSEVTGW